MKKLRPKDLKNYRESLLRLNAGNCGLCGHPIESDPVLDHCHTSGHCRNTLHRHCNALLGKVENYAFGYGKHHFSPEILRDFLFNCFNYIEADYRDKLLHPKHKTQEEKEIAKLKKRLKTVKKQETKDKIIKQIKELMND
jgi:5-methylcytosine-specific restriction endonuclease McrA